MNLWLALAEGAEHAEGAHGGGHGAPWYVEAINNAIGPMTVPIQRVFMEPLYGLFGAHWEPPKHGEEIPAHVIYALMAFAVCTIGLYFFRGELSVDKPSKRQQILEVVVSGIQGMLDDVVGPYGRRYLPIIGGFAVFIFISNLMGMFPGLGAPTNNFNVTLALGLISFFYYVSMGFRQQGIGYLKHFMGGLDKGGLIIIGVVLFFFEILSNLIRPATLGLRLFLNIFIDHTVGEVFGGMMPWIVPVLLPIPLGFFVALVQTVIFIMLSMVYLSETVPHEEHDHDEHGEHASIAERHAAAAH